MADPSTGGSSSARTQTVLPSSCVAVPRGFTGKAPKGRGAATVAVLPADGVPADALPAEADRSRDVLLVFGGFNQSFLTVPLLLCRAKDAATWVPSTPKTTGRDPRGRYGAAVFVTPAPRRRVVVFGGMNNEGDNVDTGASLDLATLAWTALPSRFRTSTLVATTLDCIACVCLGPIGLALGLGSDGHLSPALYLIERGEWLRATWTDDSDRPANHSLMEGEVRGVLVPVPDRPGHLLFSYATLPLAEISAITYDAAARTASLRCRRIAATGDMPPEHTSNWSVTALPDKTLLWACPCERTILAARNQAFYQPVPFDAVWRLDVDAWTWTRHPIQIDKPPVRRSLGALACVEDKLVLFGGSEVCGDGSYNDLYELQLPGSTAAAVVAAPAPTPVPPLAAAIVASSAAAQPVNLPHRLDEYLAAAPQPPGTLDLRPVARWVTDDAVAHLVHTVRDLRVLHLGGTSLSERALLMLAADLPAGSLRVLDLGLCSSLVLGQHLEALSTLLERHSDSLEELVMPQEWRHNWALQFSFGEGDESTEPQSPTGEQPKWTFATSAPPEMPVQVRDRAESEDDDDDDDDEYEAEMNDAAYAEETMEDDEDEKNWRRSKRARVDPAATATATVSVTGEDLVALLVRSTPALRRLTLGKETRRVTPRMLQTLAGLPQLDALRPGSAALAPGPSIADGLVSWVSDSGQRLAELHLKLARNQHLSQETMQLLLTGALTPQLTVLDLTGIGTTIATEVFAQLPPTLETLLLPHECIVTAQPQFDAAVLVQRCRRLQHLGLTLKHEGDAAVEAVATGYGAQLQRFASPARSTARTLELLAQHCPNLTALQFVTRDDDVPADAWAALGTGCARLQELDIPRAGMDDDGLVALFQRVGAMLRVMRFGYQQALTNRGFTAIGPLCGALEELAWPCSDSYNKATADVLSLAAVKSVCRGSPHMRKVVLRYPSLFDPRQRRNQNERRRGTDAWALAVAEAWPLLTELSIDCSDKHEYSARLQQHPFYYGDDEPGTPELAPQLSYLLDRCTLLMAVHVMAAEETGDEGPPRQEAVLRSRFPNVRIEYYM